MRFRSPAVAGVALGILVAVLSALAPTSARAASCPELRSREADYLCPLGPSFTVPALTDLAGWDQRAHYENILYGDLNGDGADEMVARGPAGIQVYRFDVALGQWSQVRIEPILPDRDGWNQPRYYRTIQLGDIDGDGRADLVARSPNGMVVFRYEPGKSDGVASWKQIASGGPFSGSTYDSPSYYSTIKLSPIAGLKIKPTMQLIGRGPSGLEVYRWAHSRQWDALTPLHALSDKNGWDKPEYYSTIMGWNESLLLARGPNGMQVYRYERSPKAPLGQWDALNQEGPCPTHANPLSFQCDTRTIQIARGVRGVPSDQPVILARDSQTGGGIKLARFSPTGKAWAYPLRNRNPWNQSGYDAPQYADTIRAADIDGDGHDEVIGRIASGMVAFNLDFTNGVYHWGKPRSLDTPALSDKPWAKPQYYETITTAHLDPKSKARSLIGRGPFGIRTWRFDGTEDKWTRYVPYGSYPKVQAGALKAISEFLGVSHGTVRDTYSDASRDPTLDRLQGYQNSLAATCSGPLSASPPKYRSCNPPAGYESKVSTEAWEQAANQILAELYWARQVVDHFATLDDIQTKLFLDKASQFPSMVADLKLRAAEGVVAKVDYLTPYQVISKLLSAVPKVGEYASSVLDTLLDVAENASTESEGKPTQFEHTFAQLQRHLATRQQQTRDAINANRRYVLGDYSLLVNVGRMVANDTWALDRQAALSAGREAFARWIYQSFLPQLWDKWSVTGCSDRLSTSRKCAAPDTGGLILVFPDDPGVKFYGLFPRQTPCNHFGLGPLTLICNWKTLSEKGYGDVVSTLVDRVSKTCTYDAQAGTSWHYGCSLGVSKRELLEVPSPPSPWAFRSFSCAFNAPSGANRCERVQP